MALVETEDARREREAKEKEEADAAARAENAPPPPHPMMHPDFQQYMRAMEEDRRRYQESQNKNMQDFFTHVINDRGNEGKGVTLSDFQNAPLPFASAPEAMDAEDWLMDTERKLRTVGCNDEEKIRYATYLLSGPAASWWENLVAVHPPEKVFTWEEFKKKFRDAHVPESVVELKKREFDELHQNTAPIMQYVRDFNRLSRYAPEEVDTEEKRKKRFMKGMNPYMKMQLRLARTAEFQELIDSAITFEDDYRQVQEDRRKRARIEPRKYPVSKSTPDRSFKPKFQPTGNQYNRGGQNQNPKSQIICNNCGKRGHIRKECRKPRIICYGCGQDGHMKPDCPNKASWSGQNSGGRGGGGKDNNNNNNNSRNYNNNNKKGKPYGKLNCTTLEQAGESDQAVLGKANVVADALSRKSTENQPMEWEIPKELRKELEEAQILFIQGDTVGSIATMRIMDEMYSDLKKCLKAPDDPITHEEIELQSDLTYVEKPEKILEVQWKKLRNRAIKYCKIQWQHHPEREATWETEEELRKSYPELFSGMLGHRTAVPLWYRLVSSKLWRPLRYLKRASTKLWRIIEEGYSQRDPKHLTRREVVDDQLNATAINMIHMAVTPKDRTHIRSLKTAKEAWDKLDKLFLGNESIQSSRFDEVNNMADNFVMVEVESPEEMYRRLIALAVQMQDLGATFVDYHWIKRKFYNALLPYEEVKLTAIRQSASFRAMTSDEVLSEVIALDISKKNAEDLVARAHNTRKPNLALKIREREASESDEDPMEWSPDDLKANYHEHMALAAKSFCDGNKTRISRPRRYSPRDSPRNFSKSPREGQRGRTCYNCGDKSHFVADCVYERREDNGGRLIRKDKFKSLSKGFSKFSSNPGDVKVSSTKKPRAFIIREEYSSDDGEEHEDKSSSKEEEGVAAIAISTPSISLFDSPNENPVTNNSRCLMEKVSSEVESSSKLTSPSNAISIDDATSLTIKREIVGLDAFLTNMQGDTKIHVGALLAQLGAGQDLIEEKERLEREAENEIASLNQALEEEQNLRMSLEASVIVLEDSNNALISQLTKDRDHALGLVGELKKKKLLLEDDHKSLLEEVATLTRDFKSLESKYVSLFEMSDHPQEEACKEKGDEGINSLCDELVDQVSSLKRHNALLLEVNSLQEEALDEYYRLSKEKTSCCNHEEEIATLEKTKAKLLELNGKQEESLMECLRMSKEKSTCCDHEDEIASLKRSKAKLMEINSMQEEALKDYFPLSKDRACCNHEGDIATLESHKLLLTKMNSLQE
ncbi:hypothetical protein QYE76_043516 [Lolium multiflorum]|uniref:CCHC-type domain-containing protein n=1 Tax=Lolium multiflorum TaxID=4521 RepID=A0AAD8WY98_LOLMU|nr:hypothetical protein QYE76_043516 [Lolium multiflorum]